jgi:FAD-dependent urate hydroxylase
MKKITIIGGGIGGLTAAIALQQRGFDVTVYEAAPDIKAIGAGLWVAPNAINVFERLGIADKIKNAGNQLVTSCLGDHKGNALTTVDFSKIAAKYKNGTTTIHRGTLQNILLNAVKPNTVKTNYRLKSIENAENTEGGIIVHFENGETIETDILIGADGIHSVVRKHLFGDIPLRYSGQTCWRGIAKMQMQNPKHTAELWGTKGGLRAAYTQVNAEEVYWYITLKTGKGTKIPPQEVQSYLTNLVSEFNSEIQIAIINTDNQHIIQSDLFDIKPLPQWYRGNIVLLGDAAHATTPNLGQGACQAIEDAYYLAACLSENPSRLLRDVPLVLEAFSAYQAKRKPKADFVIKTSYQLGLLNNIGGSIGFRLRNFLLKIMPQSIGERQFDYLFALDF